MNNLCSSKTKKLKFVLQWSCILVPALFLLTLCVSDACASVSELPEYIKGQLHKDITYEIITERNLNILNRYEPGSHLKHFIVVQAKPEAFKGEHADKILEWVRGGGVVWFYDSNLAHYFKMENSPYSEDKLRGKPYTGGYGTGRADGINVIAGILPFADHDLTTGVQNIQVFLLEIEKGKYSAVSTETPGVIPLFAANIENKCVVAIRKEGKGWIIFKPLVWEKVLGGERFQANLMEFSGGYPVPKSERSAIPADFEKGKAINLPRYDSIILSNGDQTICYVAEDNFSFISGEGKVDVKSPMVDHIRITPTGDVLTLKDGREFQGSLMALRIKIKSRTGKTIEIEKENIHSINFNVAQ